MANSASCLAKRTPCHAAAAGVAQYARHIILNNRIAQAATTYLAKAKLAGPRQLLTNAIDRSRFAGGYKEIQNFGRYFYRPDELAWAACELYLATGDTHISQQTFSASSRTRENPSKDDVGWWRLFACTEIAIRDYATAATSGPFAANQLDAKLLAKCTTTITNCGQRISMVPSKALRQQLPEGHTKHARQRRLVFLARAGIDIGGGAAI